MKCLESKLFNIFVIVAISSLLLFFVGLSVKTVVILVFFILGYIISTDNIRTMLIDTRYIHLILGYGLTCNFFNLFNRVSHNIYIYGINIQSSFIDSFLGVFVAFILIKILSMILDKMFSTDVSCIGSGIVYLIAALTALVGLSSFYKLISYTAIIGIFFSIYPMIRSYIYSKRYKKLCYTIGLFLYVLYLICCCLYNIKINLLIILTGTILWFLFVNEKDKNKYYKPVLIPYVPCCCLATLFILLTF